MIDHTTLPKTNEGESIAVGQRFEIKGLGFNRWPDEIVLGYNQTSVVNDDISGFTLLRLVNKTNTTLVFEAVISNTYYTPHEWNSFATPFEKPRGLLSYV